MKFLSALKKGFLIGLQLFEGFSPVFEQAVPKSAEVIQTVSQDLTEIAQVETDIELMTAALGTPGPEKLKLAAPKVADIILKSAILANHKIANPDLFTQGATKIADGMADVLNSISTDGLKIASKAS